MARKATSDIDLGDVAVDKRRGVSVTLDRVLAAKPEKIFEAWTNPEWLVRCFIPFEKSTAQAEDIDYNIDVAPFVDFATGWGTFVIDRQRTRNRKAMMRARFIRLHGQNSAA